MDTAPLISLDTLEPTEAIIKIRGRVAGVSSRKTRQFIHLRGGPRSSEYIQVVYSTTTPSADLRTGCIIECIGQVVETPARDGMEFHAQTVTIKGTSTSSYPSLCPETAGPEVEQKQRHMSLRRPLEGLMLLLNTVFFQAIRQTFERMSIHEVVPNTFVQGGCEGGAEVFSVDYPGTSTTDQMTVHLTQSAQMTLEIATQALMQSTFCIAQSYRKENSHTRRHLCEFTHIEAEFAFVETLDEHCQLLVQFLQVFFQFFERRSHGLLPEYDQARLGRLRSQGATEEDIQRQVSAVTMLQRLCEATQTGRLVDYEPGLASEAYAGACVKLHHRQAVHLLTQAGIFQASGEPFAEDSDVPEAAERQLTKLLGCPIIFLHSFPTVTKSFYMQLDPTDPTRALGVDVLIDGVGEVFGSGVRLGDLDIMKRRMAADKIKESDYSSYLEIRREGWMPTSGFGAGAGRLLCAILGAYSIKDVVPFPAYPGHVPQ